MQQQDNSYQELAESISDVFFAMDKNLRYTYWNKASERLTGIPAENALGKSLMDLYPENPAREQVKEMCTRVMETKKSEHMTVTYPGDYQITHEISTYPSREGVSVFVKDITGRIQAELALRESEEKFRTIIDNNPTSMAIVNMAGTIEYINRKAIETFGYELIDIPDMDHWWRLAYPDETYRADALAQWMSLVQKAITQQSEIEKREYLITCKSGIVKTVLVYGTIITDKVFVMFEDVTERTQAVKVLQHAHDELEERVKERTTVLTQVNEALNKEIINRQRVENIILSRQRLNEFSHTQTMEELLRATLDELEVLTGSQIGFFHFLLEDESTIWLQTWSSNTLKNMCTAKSSQQHYNVDQAGVWVDCVHQRKPVIHNDYASLPHRKGMPPGHASVTRELIVPVIQKDRILAIVGIGNKPSEYDAEDVDIVLKLAMLAWDIAERKRFEEALKDSEKQYRNIVETSLEGIWVINADFQTTYLNQRMADMLGYTMEEILRKEVKSFIFEEDLEDYELRAAARRRSLSEVFERRFRRKDGTAVWNIISSTALCDNEGRFTGSYSMFTDITARKQAEEEVRRSRQELKAIYDHVQVMICVVDEHRHVLYANPALTKFTAVSEDELKGGTACGAFGCLSALDDLRGCGFGANCPNCALRLAMEDTIKTGTEHTNVEHQTIWMIKGCQRKVTLLLSTVLVHNADQNHLLLCMHDITDRKQAEDSLRASEKVARQLAQENELIAEIGRIISSTLDIEKVYERFTEKVRETIPFDRILVSTVNLKEDTRTVRYIGGCVFPDNYVGDVFPIAGTRTEPVVLSKSSLLISSGGNNDDQKKKFPASLLRFGTRATTMVVPLISNDDVIGILTFQSAKTDAYSEHDQRFAERIGNQIGGAIANAQLFLELKQVEETRRTLAERLNRAEKMESLGTLAGGVAHDLNNVLGVLSGYSEILVEQLSEGSHLKPYAASILKSSEKGAAIIQDLLTLARRGVVVGSVIDLNRIVSDFLTTPEFDKLKTYHPQTTIRTELESELLNVKGSPVHLEKTVMNLVSNAAEAIHGSGEVHIRTENRYVDHAIIGYDQVEAGDYVVLTVSDTGGGISAADLGKIFEPFYTKKAMGRSGTGLGLAIVWGTVKDHKGYIDVQSIEGEGTTFTLYFPVTREDIAEVVHKVPIEQYMGQGESILVVDDVQEQRQVATTILTQLGYQVNSVSSGREALAYLQSNKVDIMVLDMIMDPGIDGLDTYKLILDINPHQKVIIVSGFSETDRVREAQLLGAGAYVKKPYLKEKIGVAIRDELARK